MQVMQLTGCLQQEIESKARELFDRYELYDWSFGWHKSKHSLGFCWHNKKLITLSSEILNEWEDTLRHEIAHALTPGHKHDMVWRLMCITVGAKPKATTTLKLNSSFYRYVTACTECGSATRFHHRRRPQRSVESRRCRKCRGPVAQMENPTYVHN